MLLSSIKAKFNNVDYPIQLHNDYSSLSKELSSLDKVSSFIIITEKKIGKMYEKSVLSELKKTGIPAHVIYIKGKEKNKHINRLKEVYNKLILLGTDRKSVIIALGGGVVGDFAGFVAATYQRGVRFVQLPTTLLACVDSSVGGKVAVNADRGKNMIGAFHQPSLVYAALNTLNTLPDKEWRCGFAEVLKHSLLKDESFFNSLKNINIKSMKFLDNIKLFISESVKYKSSIVAEDEKETGKRAVLNLGHTIGHAIESITEYKKYSHGEAVSIGLVFALILSVKKVNLSKDILIDTIHILRQCNMPIYEKISANELIRHILYDKKTTAKEMKFVLLEKIGHPIWGVNVNKDEIKNTLETMRGLGLSPSGALSQTEASPTGALWNSLNI